MNEYQEDNDNPYEEEQIEGNALPSWLTSTPYWMISIALHVIVLLIFGTIVVLQVEDKKEERKTVIRKEFKPPEYDPTKKRDIERKPEIVKEQKKNPVLKLNPEKVKTTPKGSDEKNLTNKELLNRSINDSFGMTGAGAGAYGNRFGKGSLTREGGSEATESAVLAALKWLERHQHPDGHWSSNGFYRPEGCENESGDGFEGYDVGVTALAMLAYLGFGHTHETGEYKEFQVVMRKAMEWMLSQQVKSDDPKLDGLYGLPTENVDEWVYNHSIATMAMAELLLMSRDRLKLRKSVESSVRWCMRSQNPGYGWKYGYLAGRNDTSVTGWMVLALKTARACSDLRHIKIKAKEYDQHFEWALKWFDSCTMKSTGICGYEDSGDPGSSLTGAFPDGDYPFSKRLSCMTAVSVLCRLFAGQSKRSEDIKQGVAVLMDELPSWRKREGKRLSKINMYYWYYASFAMFQFGDSKWKEWNEAMIDALVPTQIVGTCSDGSWDPIGEWGIAGGRVYSTAIGAMTLEVYYRFARTGS